MTSGVTYMSLSRIGHGFGVAKKIIYSILSLIKVLIPLMTLEAEIMKKVEFLQPFFLSIFDFLSQNLNIVIFVGITTLMTGAFTYFIFPMGEVACLLATAIGYLLSPRIEAMFADLVAGGATTWEAGAVCAPWIFWICLPTLFVGSICIFKRISKWGGLIKSLLISGLVTLIAGLLLGLFAYLSYGFGWIATPAQTAMLISLILVTLAEQVAIFSKNMAD